MSWLRLRVRHVASCRGDWMAMRDGSKACEVCGVWRDSTWYCRARNRARDLARLSPDKQRRAMIADVLVRQRVANHVGAWELAGEIDRELTRLT